MNITKDEILHSITRLHEWRVKHNGNDVGYGFDQYKPDEKFHYPEAYAIFGRGYLKWYQTTKNEEYLECAHKCYDWLINNPSPRYTNLSWGLPWEWKEWNAPKDLSFVCTTMYAGDFIIDMYNVIKEKSYLDNANSVYNWLITENGFRKKNNGIDFFYANHEPLKFTIYNHNGLALGFLSKLHHIQPNDNLRKLADATYRHIINNHNKYYLWPYSDKSEAMDNFHEAITIDGVIGYTDNVDLSIKPFLEKSIKNYLKLFFNSNGGGREMALLMQKRRNKVKVLIAYAKSKYALEPPARLWAYGSGIRMLAKSPFQRDVQFSETIADYSINHLQKKNGAFRFSENNDIESIRNEAHIFDGLTTLL